MTNLIEQERVSSLIRREGFSTLPRAGVSHLDTLYDEQTSGDSEHDQKVQAKVHYEDKGASKHPPLSATLRSHSLNRARAYLNVESSLGIADRATLSRMVSLSSQELARGAELQDPKIVSDDGK